MSDDANVGSNRVLGLLWYVRLHFAFPIGRSVFWRVCTSPIKGLGKRTPFKITTHTAIEIKSFTILVRIVRKWTDTPWYTIVNDTKSFLHELFSI